MNTRKIGKGWEITAASYLAASGFEIIELNYSCRYGEVDIIAKDGNYLVFCEVKYRKSRSAGLPMEAVSYEKQKKIIGTAYFYIINHNLPENTEVRFDVVSILAGEITLIKNAFQLEM